MSRKTCGAFIVLAVLSMVAPIWAHHSPSAIFDMTKRTPLSGVLTRVDWINPHVIVLIDVKTDSGKTETWKFESNPPLWFKKVGVNRADFAKAIGQPVKVEVNSRCNSLDRSPSLNSSNHSRNQRNSRLNFAWSPSSSLMRRSWLYFATRSVRDMEPVLIWPALVATARSAINVSSLSPERWEITTP
jgi:Family of unknown function (DUF6152)